jgi:integrase/recombinase XerD
VVGSGDSVKLNGDHLQIFTNLANKCVSDCVLMELVGHSSMEVTQKYIEVNPNMMRSAVELL